METYNNNFLTKENEVMYSTLQNIAIKIRDKILSTGNSFLLTQSTIKEEPIKDSLYGYIYSNDLDIYEREVKGFCVTKEGALFICMDLSSVKYTKDILEDTFNDYDEDTWFLLLNEKNTLVAQDGCNIYLTLLSIAECVYQYFK